jgi:uncharacterized protein
MMTSQVVPMPNSQASGAIGSATRTALNAGALPSILGMYAFAAATFIVAAYMAHWYGTAQSAIVLFPLVLFFGLAQFYAGARAMRTGDAVAVAMHGSWGAFWTAFGILELLSASGQVIHPLGAFSSELGFWFIAIAAITWAITAASRENPGITTLLALLAIGSTLEAIAELAGVEWLRMLAGYFLIVSAIVAWGVATTQMMQFASTNKADKKLVASSAVQSESVHAA